MDLKILIDWAVKEKDPKNLKEKIKKEGYFNISKNLLDAITTRGNMIAESEKRIEKLTKEIVEYVKILERYGIVYGESKPNDEVGTVMQNPPAQTQNLDHLNKFQKERR